MMGKPPMKNALTGINKEAMASSYIKVKRQRHLPLSLPNIFCRVIPATNLVLKRF
jgi:hypothetical protein